MVFPFVGAFHVLLLVYTLWSLQGSPMGMEWLQVVWMVAYTVCWGAACLLHKCGALGYVFLTLLDAVLYLAVKDLGTRELVMSNLFLTNGIFSFLILVYFKQFK
jgi:hypothetical protein